MGVDPTKLGRAFVKFDQTVTARRADLKKKVIVVASDSIAQANQTVRNKEGYPTRPSGASKQLMAVVKGFIELAAGSKINTRG